MIKTLCFKPQFRNQEEQITFEKARQLRTFFCHHLAVGYELETSFNKPVNQEEIERLLSAQHDYSYLNEYGVNNCYADGSIRGRGVSEIVIVGNTTSYDEYHTRLKKIEDKLMSLESNNNESCSQHCSLVLTQGQRVPAVVLKNFYQTWRGFADSFLWLSSATNMRSHPNWVIRPQGVGNFCSVSSIMQNTATMRSLKQLKNTQTKYTALNLSKMLLTQDEQDIGQYFVENRTPDRHQVAHASTAFAFLMKAVTLKAISLSEYGVLSFSQEDFEKTQALTNKLSTGTLLTEEDKLQLTERALSLISFVKPDLEMIDGFSLTALKMLAKEPISLRYRVVTARNRRGQDKKIEESFETEYQQYLKPLKDAEGVRQIIGLGTIAADTPALWTVEVAKQMSKPVQQVEINLIELKTLGSVEWNDDAGTFQITEKV